MLPNLIAFCGRPAVGKSTQIHALSDFLQSKHVKTHITGIKAPHTIAYVLWLIYQQMGFGPPFAPPIRSRLDRYFWIWFHIIGVLVALFFRIYLPIWLGYIVISEGYVLDSLVVIAIDFLKDEKFLQSWYSSLILQFIPQNSLIIYFYGDADEITKRRKKRGSEADLPLLRPRTRYQTYDAIVDLTKTHNRVYHYLSKRVGAHLINVSESSLYQTHRTVKSLMKLQISTST